MPRADIQSQGLLETLVSSAARTASGDSGPIKGWGSSSKIRVQLDVTAATGTSPTLDVLMEDTLDGTNWNTVGTLTQRTAPGREVINITAPFSETLRVRWAMGGTSPSFTFSVKTYSE